jgi:HEAT repeat protein
LQGRGVCDAALPKLPFAVESGERGPPRKARPQPKGGLSMPIGRPNVERLDAKGLVEGLLRASKYKKDPEVAEQARQALERRMPILLDTLQSKNTRHMVLARDSFRQIGEPAVVFLADVVDHGDVGRRQDAVHLLGEVRLASAIPVLSEGLKGRDSGVRLLAVRSLSNYSGVRVDALLTSALRDRDEAVRVSAMKALKKRGLEGT